MTAVSTEIDPLQDPPKQWGYKAVDTREVQLTPQHYDLIAVVAFHVLGSDHEGLDDPAVMMDAANRQVGAASPTLISNLMSDDLRLTPLEKALTHASEVLSK